MLESLLSAFARLEPVHVARTEEERAAIYRLRYDIYFREKNALGTPGLDHARQQVRTPEDELPETTLYYTGSPHSLKGTLRVRTWSPGKIPPDCLQRYALHRFPGIETRTVCTVGFLMTPRTLRGSAGVVALTSAAVERTVLERGVEMVVAECAPGLLRSYQRLGLRPFGARVLSSHQGMQIPVAGLTADLEHARRCRSPWYPVLRKLGAQGKLPSRDFSELLGPFARSGVETDPDRIQGSIEASLARHRSPFLERLPKRTRRRLARGGTIFDVDPEVDMLVEGFANRDVFVVLEGAIEIRVGGATVTTVRPGELLGEVAFFHQSGHRSATAHSVEPGRVLHLSNGFLRRLAKRRPADGVAVYDSLAQVLAVRLAAWSPSGRESTTENGAALGT